MQRFNTEDFGPEFKEWRKIRRRANLREGAFATAAVVGVGLLTGYVVSCESTETSSQPSAVVANPSPEQVVVSYDDPTESAQYWARGGSDEKVTVSDINIAKTYADMVEDPGEATLVSDVLSYEASLAAAYAASGSGNGSITVNDFKVAEYLADVSAEYGDHADSAYEAIASNAITVGNYWQQGGADGVADDQEHRVANYYYDIAASANQAVLAD
ncbi:MAG: hypothetical protein QG553_490 [Patescibacteria group bacterium]|nr:hypothetical protein [Patescibacteria group bacterium]